MIYISEPNQRSYYKKTVDIYPGELMLVVICESTSQVQHHVMTGTFCQV